jgi:membrane protease YdiL (CAAX protease family)
VRRGAAPVFWWAFGLLWIVWAVRASIGFRIDLAIAPDHRPLYSNAIKLTLWALPAAAFAWWARRESPVRTLKLGAPRARELPLAIGLTAVYLAGVAWDVLRKRRTSPGVLVWALEDRGALTFAAALPSAFAEEVLFRGLVLTELAERWGFWRANLVSGLLFVTMHWPHRLWRDGATLGAVADTPQLLLLALALGFVTWRTGSIWPAVVFHAANNTISGIL